MRGGCCVSTGGGIGVVETSTTCTTTCTTCSSGICTTCCSSIVGRRRGEHPGRGLHQPADQLGHLLPSSAGTGACSAGTGGAATAGRRRGHARHFRLPCLLVCLLACLTSLWSSVSVNRVLSLVTVPNLLVIFGQY